MIYGYARVSTTDQNLDRQHNAFKDYEIKVDKVVDEKGSGKNFKDRPEYQKLRKQLKQGDALIILLLDRLGRNYTEILNEWRYLTEKKQVDIYVIDMPVLNTKNNCDGLDGKFISNLVLQILAYVSQKERENTVARVKQGMANAKEKGIRLGRPPATYDLDDFHKSARLFMEGKITSQQACEMCGLARPTFYRKLHEHSYRTSDYRNPVKIKSTCFGKTYIYSSINEASKGIGVSDKTIAKALRGEKTILDEMEIKIERIE